MRKLKKLIEYIIVLLYVFKVLNITKNTDTYIRIKYLLKKKINVYNNPKSRIHIECIETDIIAFTEAIKKINEFPIFDSYLEIKRITENSIKHKTMLEWCTKNRYLLTDESKYINNMLIEAEKLYNLYQYIQNKPTLDIAYSNSIKIKPYIINIIRLVDNLIETTT
jgi:hypothetical protein